LFSRAGFDYLKGKDHLAKGYVVMPNHIDALIYFSKTDKPINKMVGVGKRLMAYGIVKRLKEKGKEYILRRLQEAVEAKDKQRGKSMRCGKTPLIQRSAIPKSSCTRNWHTGMLIHVRVNGDWRQPKLIMSIVLQDFVLPAGMRPAR
jgi:hypothetical protein